MIKFPLLSREYSYSNSNFQFSIFRTQFNQLPRRFENVKLVQERDSKDDRVQLIRPC